MSARTLLAALLLAGAAAGASAQATSGLYIVQLADEPVAAYRGAVAGYPATRPAAGTRLNVNASHVRSYLNYLDARRNAVLGQVPAGSIVHRYSVAFNGFSARLTPEQARKLRASPGVVAVTVDEPRQMDTTRTPAFLGLTAPGGLWSRVDAASRPVKGEGIVLGIVDGGIWPENPSFSDKVNPTTGKPVPSYEPGTVVYGPPPAGWTGTCQPGQGFTTAMCNNKLIGAQFFNAGFLAFGRPLWPTDYVGPRDEDGHGSHVASTAGGNEGVDATIAGLPVGAMSGIAPRARIAAYRVCWSYVEAGTGARKNSCFVSDSVAAIDKAVADGVDAINFSISGSRTNTLDPVEVAFFNATAAGVFVATSAGNEGPGNTVAHPSPWVATVAATTHDRYTVATVTLGNGATFSGPSYQTSGVPSSPLVLARNAGVTPYANLSATDQAALDRCYNAADRASLGGSAAAVLDPAKTAGRIVVCIRGGNVLVNKADAVQAAGGRAMLLQNAAGTSNTLVYQPYVIPTVHLDAAAAPTVLAYAAAPTATASFGPGTQVPGVVAPQMGDFSSRGPNLADANILKPDLAAPGVDIVAAYVPPNSAQQSVRDAIVAGALGTPAANSLQGTSMASPHVLGAAALLRQLHPTWSPSAIKSAVMTSTTDVKIASGAADPARFGYGAGQLNPNGAADPGLVYDAGPADYLRYLCGAGLLAPTGSTCSTFGAISAWNLNLPSLTASEVLGRITFTRTLTNPGNATANFVATASLPGYDVAVVPSSVSLAPGASASFDVSLARTTAAVGAWTFGSVVWSDGSRQVRSPLTARGSLFAGPSEVSDARTAGAKVFTVGTGYNGTLVAIPTGLVPATRSQGSVATNQQRCFDTAIPAGTQHARWRLYDADTQGGAASDLDLEVYNGPGGTGTLVGASGSATTEEQVDLATPPAGTYSACVVGYAPAGGQAAFALSSWVLGAPATPQTLRAAAPARVFLGGTGSVAVSWSVAKGSRYLGVVRFTDGGATTAGRTLVAVDGR